LGADVRRKRHKRSTNRPPIIIRGIEMPYTVVSHWIKSGLESKVNELMADGWIPQGNATVAMTDTYADSGKEPEYLQAMIKGQTNERT
jgi:transketolase C-terminal domain/subunit